MLIILGASSGFDQDTVIAVGGVSSDEGAGFGEVGVATPEYSRLMGEPPAM